ncbi:hypothetical protein AC249_AIPGENE6109 [Exaiptasia diaphana]|nr:hypothetical protein AC249_AIPGENE6109 [Exaiptasia diaphana]
MSNSKNSTKRDNTTTLTQTNGLKMTTYPRLGAPKKRPYPAAHTRIVMYTRFNAPIPDAIFLANGCAHSKINSRQFAHQGISRETPA